MIQGTKGCIRVEGHASSAGRAELFDDGGVRVIAEDEKADTLSRELEEFARQHKAGDFESCYRMLEHSVMTMEVLETAKEDGKVEFQ